jgi:light-regulated signal transduction histidine kinase (bacteriophytochrome)
VADNKNYSIRAKTEGHDEVGQLTSTFNHMLETIQNRDNSLVRQAEELWRSNQELEQFAYISSHDLQEPLRKITTYAQLLQVSQENNGKADSEKYISNICSSADRMRTLIQDLLSYSRLNKGDMMKDVVDLHLVLQQVLNDFEDKIKAQNIQVTYDPLPTVIGNMSQLHQLLQNLIANAIKFQDKKDPQVKLTVEIEKDTAKIGVKDNGIGIDARYFDQIFKVFQRLHSKDKYPGTGIGLAICKKIVEHHGGRLWVDSKPNEGATFFLSFPKNSPPNLKGQEKNE